MRAWLQFKYEGRILDCREFLYEDKIGQSSDWNDLK